MQILKRHEGEHVMTDFTFFFLGEQSLLKTWCCFGMGLRCKYCLSKIGIKKVPTFCTPLSLQVHSEEKPSEKIRRISCADKIHLKTWRRIKPGSLHHEISLTDYFRFSLANVWENDARTTRLLIGGKNFKLRPRRIKREGRRLRVTSCEQQTWDSGEERTLWYNVLWGNRSFSNAVTFQLNLVCKKEMHEALLTHKSLSNLVSTVNSSDQLEQGWKTRRFL